MNTTPDTVTINSEALIQLLAELHTLDTKEELPVYETTLKAVYQELGVDLVEGPFDNPFLVAIVQRSLEMEVEEDEAPDEMAKWRRALLEIVRERGRAGYQESSEARVRAGLEA